MSAFSETVVEVWNGWDILAFPETVIEDWNEWEIRALLLLSLSLQLILIAFGSQRKYSTSIWIRSFVWSAYMSADSVVTLALGILARNLACDSGEGKLNRNIPLQLFWTPFLILHLGGPDTITAYSLEDDELWSRHFLGLLVQTGTAFYVFVKSWGDNHLKFISILVFIAGIIKYGERTWALRNSSTKNIRNSLFPELLPDFGVGKAEREESIPRDVLRQAHHLLKRLKYLFADLILDEYDQSYCRSVVSNKSSEEAFELVESELGLFYDVLYTKATIVYSKYGVFLRCSSFFSSVFAMIAFAVFIEHPYSPVDISITYLLLVGAIVLELYAFVLIMLSDWTKLWLLLTQKTKMLRLLNYLKGVRIGKRWSRTIFKYNLIKFCLKEQDTMWIRFQKLLGIEEIVEKYLNIECHDVDATAKPHLSATKREKSEY
ncbi:hypothetical protein DITRI_Ditri09bG0051400 [Diplodiscus trichospermus]